MKTEKFNFVTLLLLLFIFIISFLYYELYQFNQQRNAYIKYEKTIHQLTLKNITIDAILKQKLTYLSYDILNNEWDDFALLLQELQDNPLNEVLNINKNDFYHKILVNYNKKVLLSEDFKSSNAGMLNSVHYLFDLEKKLQKDPNISLETKQILNQIIYSLINLTLGLDLSFDNIKNSIKTLASRKEENKNIQYFVNHSFFALEKTKELSRLSKEVVAIPLPQNIRNLLTSFRTSYEEKLHIQQFSVSVIFILLILSTIFIYILYRKAKVIFLELSAFKYAVENSDNTVVITDPDRNIIYANDVFSQTTGYSTKEALGKNPSILKSGLMKESFYKELNETLDRGEKWTGEFINKKSDGSLYYEKASIVPIFVNKKLISYLAIKLDITQYVKQHKELQQSATVFEHTMDGIMITNEEGIIISVNKALCKMTGYDKDELIGQNPNILSSGQQDEEFYEKMWEHILSEGSWQGKIFNRTKAGLLTQTWLSISSVKDEKGEVTSFIAIHTDLNELIIIQEKIDHMAHHDSLTGLANRRFLEESLDNIIKVSKRKNQNFSLIFLDLDRFKIINDTLGHDVGDKLLQIVSKRIKQTLRNSDILARMGGDEFIIVSQDIKSKEEPAYICTKILKSLEKRIEIQGHVFNITASIGIAIFPEDGETIANLVKNADSAMYHAKNMGKNNYQYFTEKLSIDIHQRLKIEQALQNALKNRELSLNYQPQYDLKTRRIIAAEALLRWNSKELGFIGPDKFIPIAEETRLILPIGEFVFEEACKAFMMWKEHCIDIHTIAINVSSIQLAQDNIVSTFQNIIKRVGIAAENVEIEITERYIVNYIKEEDTVLNELRNLGFKISIDDFGTGYSSMSYLKLLPIDTIKIDKSFIDDIPHNKNDVQITKAIMALSQSLDYINVAEGIETKEQEEFLKNEGCQIGQGYFFQRPVDNDTFIAFCKECAQEKVKLPK